MPVTAALEQIRSGLAVIQAEVLSGTPLTKSEWITLSTLLDTLRTLRNEDIVASVEAGESLALIAARWNLTPARISQITHPEVPV